MHCLSWVIYLNFLCPGRYLCWLKSQLSFISLLSFEMLSDCVISGLYMRVLKLTWEQIDFYKFSSVLWCFSVEGPDGYSWRLDGWSLVIRTWSGNVRTRAATNGRTVRILVRMCATYPYSSEAARIRMTLIHRSCNDPPPMTQYCPLLASHTRLRRRSPILGLLSQRLA
jgi:hypothetical protein